ncbi:redoxin domain-containing protein [Aliikangiella sp. G2MR2-5]|uniref:TlpA family protein disulfide reductase n=1 Tax=Aliikangiella sp. G2MR2-5 TaxID=2788943 RepID=UPI0018A9E8E4|nr:redoxin domain-containing protein [Aliikangiella sp. G2MR2-5]
MQRILNFVFSIFIVTGASFALAEARGGINAAPVTHQLAGIKLHSLQSEDVVDLEGYIGKPLLLSFYEDKCRWCLRQIKAYNRLNEKSRMQFVMAGIGDSNRLLRLWAKRARPEIPILKASQKLLELIGDVPATPYTLIFDSRGRFVTKVTGYMDEDKLELLSKSLTCET